MTKISQFSYKGQDIDVLYNKGKLSYIFEAKGKRFGNAVKMDSRKIEDIMAATMCLLINYLETKEASEKL